MPVAPFSHHCILDLTGLRQPAILTAYQGMLSGTTLCNLFSTLCVSCDHTSHEQGFNHSFLICFFQDASVPNEGFEPLLVYVRMAEGSKAPDSSTASFLSQGISGLRMEAWVQIPLLTGPFFFFKLPQFIPVVCSLI